MVSPTTLTQVEAQISIPNNTRPIQFQPLNLKLCRDIFEIIRRTCVLLPFKKPLDRIGFHANINSMGLKALSL